MYKKSIKNIIVILAILMIGISSFAQEKVEVRPYTIATTVEKLKKDYPFIKPINPLTSDSFLAVEDIAYKETETSVLKLDVYYPSVKTEKKRPAVLLVHGGGWISGSKENQRIMAQHLADYGFVAVAASYRLSLETKYPAAVIDLKDALRWMRKNAETYKLNPNKIAILGTSAGAQLATLIGVTADSKLYNEKNKTITSAVQAIVNIDGIVSFIHPEASAEGEMAGFWLDGNRDINPKNWKEASPLEYVNNETPPTLFINSAQPRFHAGRDDMVKILNENGIYSEVHTLEDSPHSFWLLHPWFETTLEYTVSFLDKVFKNSEK
ncbi:alpha/beta hydrolase [Flavimarina sp. Hel_I_48]|uniref:alpha/beta hydrolase n=1 Tax=Flavimarina sp. Hel_I_48 TaxID=1392488 RepID=UPI000B15AA6A|nr:alpha/beta hydrolase [Flavimarina sp. Hel_I_48]